MFHEQLFFRCLLDGVCDPLTMLRSKDQGAEDQQIQCPLQQFQPLSSFLGRHITRVCFRQGKMSTRKEGVASEEDSGSQFSEATEKVDYCRDYS